MNTEQIIMLEKMIECFKVLLSPYLDSDEKV